MHSKPPAEHSVKPEDTVYSGPSAASPRRVTLRTLRKKYEAGTPISMVTAYDYPSAVHVRTWVVPGSLALAPLTDLCGCRGRM